MKRLRVYISSTYEDLREYRNAVFAALDKAGLDIGRMESYTAADERPLDLCLRDVMQSDIYVGIYAWRYGYVPPPSHGNSEGKSITELEYCQAERANLRKLLFFAHPDTQADWDGRFKDTTTGEGERGEKLNRFRQELGADKTVGFFRTPDELATLTLAAIMRSGLGGRPYNIQGRATGLIARPELTKAVIEALVGVGSAAGANTLTHGAGGFGKTTLAIDACHHPEVVSAFPDGLLWLTLGEKPELERLLTELHVVATGHLPLVTGRKAVGEALGQALKGRRCLVVLDDVWHASDLEPFLHLDGPRLLVTTRIRTLIEQAGQIGWSDVTVGGMTLPEAASLLGRGLAVDVSASNASQRLAGRLGYWPLLLELANARAREEYRGGRGTVADCLDYVESVLQRKGVVGFDRRNPNKLNDAVATSVEAGLEWAEEMFPGLASKAAEISMFPEDVAIPARVLSDLWSIDAFDLEEEVLRPLDNISLVRWDRQSSEIRLHMMIHRVLEARLLKTSTVPTAAVHRRLMDAWPDPNRLPHNYAWRWFGWHCIRANEPRRLQRLLVDFTWLQAKLDATSVNALIQDFDRLLEQPDMAARDAAAGRSSGSHGEIRDALRLSASVLARDTQQLAPQLLGRLSGKTSSFLDALLVQAAAKAQRPWLRPTRAGLAPPGGDLQQTLSGNVGGVLEMRVLSDDLVAARCADGIERVWNLTSGVVVRESPLDVPIEDLYSTTFMEHWHPRLLEELRGTTYCWTELDERRVAVGDAGSPPNGRIRVWNVVDGTCEQEVLCDVIGSAHAVTAIASLDGSRVVTGSNTSAICLWDLSDATFVRRFSAHSGTVRCFLSLGSNRFASGAEDETVKIWSVSVSVTERPHHDSDVRAVAATKSLGFISAGSDERVLLWHPDRDPVVLAEEAGWIGPFISVGDDHVAGGSTDGFIRVWCLGGDRPGDIQIDGRGGWNTSLAYPGGHRLASAGSTDGSIRIWDLRERKLIRTLRGHSGRVMLLLPIEPDCLASVSLDGTVRVWDVSSGSQLCMMASRTLGSGVVAVGTRYLVMNNAEEELVRVDWKSGETVVLRPGVIHVSSLAADGPDICCFSRDGLLVIDVETGALRGTLNGFRGSHRVWLDNRHVAAADGSEIQVWSLDQSAIVARSFLDGPVTAMAGVSGTRSLVAGDRTGVVQSFVFEQDD